MRYKVPLILICLLFSYVQATVKGSESALSIEPYYTFLASESDNTMLGFGWFRNGFALEDATASCTFNSVFPVSGDVYLNGGDFYLSADFLLHNQTIWHTPGSIYANSYLVDICSSVTSLGGQTYGQNFDNAYVGIHGDLRISGSVKFSGECLVDGNGKRILLEDDGYLLIDANSTVTFKDIYLDGIAEGKICMLDDSSVMVLDDVCWIQDGDYSFTQGSLKIFNAVDFVGTYTFSYETEKTSTIGEHSYWHICGGIWLMLGKNNGIEPLHMTDETSVLHLDNCTLSSNDEGFCLTHGELLCCHQVTLDIPSTSSLDGVVLGNGNAEDDVVITIGTGASLHFVRGHLVYDVTDSDALVARSEESRLIRYSDTYFYANQDLNISHIKVVDKNIGAALVVEDGINVFYDNAILDWDGVGLELTGYRINWYTILLDGNHEIFLSRGTFPAYVSVQNTGNILHGPGSLSGQIILGGPTAEIQVKLHGPLLESVVLNGGTITLAKSLEFLKDYRMIGSGAVTLGGYSLVLGEKDQSWTGDIFWDGTNGHIGVNSKIELSGTWTFSGSCVLHGNGHVLTLSSDAQIVVDHGSSLELQNLRIEGVSGNNIKCLGAGSSILYDNCKMYMTGNYSFTTGYFNIQKLLDVNGTYSFEYKSDQQSSINSCSTLRMREGTELSYAPITAQHDRLSFTDFTSKLKLNGSTLHSTSTGWLMTHGTMDIDGECYLRSDATVPAEGVWFGDGESADNDFDVNLLPGSNPKLSGYWIDKNVL